MRNDLNGSNEGKFLKMLMWLIPIALFVVVYIGVFHDVREDKMIGKDRSSHRALGNAEDDCV